MNGVVIYKLTAWRQVPCCELSPFFFSYKHIADRNRIIQALILVSLTLFQQFSIWMYGQSMFSGQAIALHSFICHCQKNRS